MSMKIGIVCYPTYGGSGVLATELGKSLAQKGHEVHFITYQIPVRLNTLTENIHYHEVKPSNYPLFDYSPYELVLASKIVDVVKYEKLDLLHVHYAIPHASAAYTAREILKKQGIKIPFVTTLHGTDITLVGKDPSFEPVITFAINESNAVTAVSNSLKQDTFENFDINREIEVNYNFICPAKYEKKQPCQRSLFAQPGQKIITHVSNFRPVKRVQDVIESFALIREEIDAVLVLVGEGPEKNRIELLARQLGVDKQVKYLGKIKDVEQVLCLSDLFILTSQSESFGLAALEAMAAGVPVISTNTGGLPEVNIQGKTGYLSEVGDIKDLSANAIKVLSDEKLAAELSQNAKEQSKNFEINSILKQYEEIYKRITAL